MSMFTGAEKKLTTYILTCHALAFPLAHLLSLVMACRGILTRQDLVMFLVLVLKARFAYGRF